MIREIKTYPNKILKQKAKRVGALDDEIKKLVVKISVVRIFN